MSHCNSHLYSDLRFINAQDENLLRDGIHCSPIFPRFMGTAIEDCGWWIFYLSSIVCHPPSFITLVSNGTAALVFRCIGRKGVIAVLTSITEKLRSKFSEYWDQFLQKPENQHAVFYVKVATAVIDGRGPRWSSIDTFQYMTNDDDFSRTYPVKSLINTSFKCEIILMADRGNPINERTVWSPEQFHQMFEQFQTKTLALSKKACLHHGDIARHNVLLGTDLNGVDQLVLIDWDEARSQIKQRECGNDPYMKLRHPEALRRDQPVLYTNVQLSLLYWQLRREHVERIVDWLDNKDAVPGLKAYSDALVKYDQTDDYDDNLFVIDAANEFVSSTQNEIEAQLENQEVK